MKNRLLLITCALFISLLSACGPTADKTPGLTATVSEPTAVPTQRPTETVEPTATTVPATPTEAVTNTPASTATPTLPAEMQGATFFTGGLLSDWRYFISIQAQQPITGQYYAMVDGNKEYECHVETIYPDRLYCVGRLPAVDKTVEYVVHEQQSGAAVFEGEVFIPLVLP